MKTPIIEGVTQGKMNSYLANRQYEELYWPTFFPTLGVDRLDGQTLIGAVGSRVAAHVISYNAKAPEAGRKTLGIINFDIPKIAQSRRKTEKEILEHRIAKALRGPDAVIEDYFKDLDFVFDSAQSRKEWYALVALSTTKLQLTTANNPQGIVNESVVDFGMPAANKMCASVIWAGVNADPITDFKAVIKAARAKGITFARILMTSDTFDLMQAATLFKAFFLNTALNVTAPINLDTINTLLGSYKLPPITLIDTSIGIEAKSGLITATNPWSVTHITFIPDIKCGDMFSGPIAEQLEPPDGVILSLKGDVSMSIRREYNPVSVLTKAECNVFPSWTNVAQCFSLYTGHTTVWV